MKLLLAHGPSDSINGEQVRALAENVSSLLTEEGGTAFLSYKKLPHDAQILPLFLGAGTHMSEDIPKLAAVSKCSLLAPLAEQSESNAALAYDALTLETKRINTLFAIYRFGGFESLVAALHASNKRCSQVAIASMHSDPSISSVLDLWHNDGLTQVTIQPMLLFAGHSLARVENMITESMMNTTLAPVLSEYEGFAELVANLLRSSDET